MPVRAPTWCSSRGSSSSTSNDVWFVCKGGTVPRDPPPVASETLHKRGGSHGGATTWKSRWCQLVGSTLYYSDSPRAAEAKGHIKLVGLGVRKADVEVDCEEALLAATLTRSASMRSFAETPTPAGDYNVRPRSSRHQNWNSASFRAATDF